MSRDRCVTGSRLTVPPAWTALAPRRPLSAAASMRGEEGKVLRPEEELVNRVRQLQRRLIPRARQGQSCPGHEHRRDRQEIAHGSRTPRPLLLRSPCLLRHIGPCSRPRRSSRPAHADRALLPRQSDQSGFSAERCSGSLPSMQKVRWTRPSSAVTGQPGQMQPRSSVMQRALRPTTQ